MSEEAKKETKNKKIGKMSLDELNSAIEKTKEKQGGLFSRYAKELIKRKDTLSSKK